mgnify:CR=1 FL=1
MREKKRKNKPSVCQKRNRFGYKLTRVSLSPDPFSSLSLETFGAWRGLSMKPRPGKMKSHETVEMGGSRDFP